jgi:cystinosin
MPQVYLNWKRQSTVGWSLHNVILDFTGGFFSFGQMIVDSTARGKPLFGDSDSGFNIVKFLLAVIAMIFDLIFLFQHYVLYRSAWEQELKISVRQNALERV